MIDKDTSDLYLDFLEKEIRKISDKCYSVGIWVGFFLGIMFSIGILIFLKSIK